MRELRKDVESTLNTSKEELVDNIDEIKIEEVLMGLKGLKQEEVFSFLGKNNFTPAETEEWLKMMASSGFGNYDHLATVDTADMEQLQLSFDDNFNGFQGANDYQKNSFPKSDPKRRDGVCAQKASVFHATTDSLCDWDRKDVTGDDKHEIIKLPSLDFRRTSSAWSKYSGTQVTYSLADGYLENLREEEIVSTPMNEDVADTELEYPASNAFVIQSSDVESVEIASKPKPIKLLIKRVENEELDTTNPEPVDNTRTKSKRIPCAKRKFEATLPPPKRKKCTRKPAGKSKEKNDSIVSKKKSNSFEESDFPFPGTVHQDDDFVYPSLDMSDDEEDNVFSFSQPDDETWTPKIKMKINQVKPVRPTRDRKTKSAVAKCLEAAAMKRADSNMNNSGRRRCTKKLPKTNKVTVSTPLIANGDLIIKDGSVNGDHSFVYSVPSTSNVSTPSSSFAIMSESSDTSSESPVKKLPKKGRPKGQTKSNKLIPPKTCKLIQTPGIVQLNQSVKRVKTDLAASPSNSEKKHTNSYVTKRGKPKKGMATAKQRLGKLLKMHKMFF